MIYRIKHFFGMLPCILDKNAVLHKSARIVNNLGDKERIKVGAFSHVRGTLLTFGHGGSISIGEYCYVGDNSRLWSALSVTVGDRVLISHDVNIFDNSTHPISPKERHVQFKTLITSGFQKKIDLDERPVVINDDAWIGCMSIILPGVTIGHSSIVGAGSVVTKDVPPWTIVAGNPARIIREIPPEDR